MARPLRCFEAAPRPLQTKVKGSILVMHHTCACFLHHHNSRDPGTNYRWLCSYAQALACSSVGPLESVASPPPADADDEDEPAEAADMCEPEGAIEVDRKCDARVGVGGSAPKEASSSIVTSVPTGGRRRPPPARTLASRTGEDAVGVDRDDRRSSSSASSWPPVELCGPVT